METTKEERDELRDDPHPQPEDVRAVIRDADLAEELLEALEVVCVQIRERGVHLSGVDIAERKIAKARGKD